MAYYQRSHFRVRRGSPNPVNRWLVLVGVLAALILVTRALADRSGAPGNANESNANATASDLSLLNLSGNENVNAAEANTNASTASSGTFPAGFLSDFCAKPISEFGTKKLAVLTFDAGAGTGSAEAILSILREKRAPAAAFFTGKWAEQNPAAAKSFADAGLDIFNHSYDHPSFTSLSKAEMQEQLSKAGSAIRDATGVDPKPVFRPPYGDYNDTVVSQVKAAGYCPVLWTVDALDWQDGQTADAAKSRVLDRLKPGAIVLMHVGDDLVPNFLPALIDEIRNRGYALVGLPDLFAQNPVVPKANVNAGNVNSAGKNGNTNAAKNVNGKKSNSNSNSNSNANASGSNANG
jgi:peptidoglycan/xylan/chitin deacetylase (PgdA/CDA1 family)